jgi:amino acid adenylation domain-containing protein
MSSDLTVETERKWLDLSLAQQAVWLDAKLSGSAAYQLGAWVRITGSPDESVLRQAISLTMARHDGLRLRVDDELPRQWLDESVEPPFAVLDLAPGVTDPDAAFQAHVEDRFSIPMPLGDHPLFSVELIRVGANLNYMLWRFHHLLADSASVSIAIAHGLNAYEALAGGTQELTPGSSYLKTISADAAYLESAAYQKDLAYWSSRFEPLPPALIADLEARPTGENKVPFAEWKLEGEDFKEFQDAARTAGTTIQRALFALFTMALGRRYGQSDIVSGVALHRRDLATRHTVGMMAGVIAMRCQFDAYWTLEECIQAYSEQLDRDLRHQRLPVDILSRALGLAGSGRAGLFEAAMSYMPSSRGWKESAVEGLPFTAGHVVTKEASPISLGANESESGDALDITIAINTDYLDAAEAQTLLTLLKTACHQFLHAPDICFENLPTLTPGEQSLVVTQWNKTATMFESGTLDGLFAAQVKRTPEAIAVVGRDGQSLTYAALDEQSTRLARALAAHGIKPERVVGVKMERSAETIIALLAILKAGGVYLPLDPAYPKERLEYMVYDAGALLVLESINDLSGDADLPSLSDPRFNDPRRLAYIIYTSGTTGLPKGVEVPHSAPVNLAFARRACHDPLGVGDRVLAGISVGFDVSIGQLLLPLLSGATVVIADDLKSMGADEFWALLAKQQVTHINSVPSFLDSILSAAPAASTLALKRLMLGGEALSGALVARIQRMLPGVEVVNMYGPTEACVDATFHVATQADLSAPVLPIGKPLSNYRAYVLNSLLEPVGVGVTGELVLGGAGIARGYVNAADLTSDRFVADPFSPDPVSSKPGDRLYRTGDRARWRADGVLEFLGRVDQQVKIRGFRVEPGEIAATLLQHPDVSQAVVVARAHQTSAALRLVAYVVPRGSDALPETSDLRAFLSERLPDYMVPAAFVSIAAIPLSRNGKLDEKALPSPDLRDGEYVAPRSAAEETVAKLFAEVLGLERCGATDNFFELGGHSLMAVSLIERLKRQGIPVSVRSLFLTPTVAGLASSIDAQTAEVAVPANLIPPDCTAITPEMLPLVKLSQEQIDRIAASIPGGAANIQDIYPLAPLQEGILFQHRIAPKGDPYLTQSLFSFDNRARLDRFIGALDPVIARHDVLRTAIRWKEIDQPVQVVLRAAVARIEEVELDTSSTVSPAVQLTQRFHPNTYRIDLTERSFIESHHCL